MPKSNEKDVYFFSHDCNARNDPKVLALRSIYGAEGYGVYFMIIEILRDQPDYKIPVNKYLWNTLAMQMQIEASKLQSIVEDCCNEFVDRGSALLINDGEYLYSQSLNRRMSKMDDVGEKRRKAAEKRWESQACEDVGTSVECKPNANAVQKHSKIKENKVKENKIKESKVDLFAAFSRDDKALLSALNGFAEMRVKIKKPLTDKAKEMLLADLQKLSDDPAIQGAILNQSIFHSWQGVFQLKIDAEHEGRTKNGITGTAPTTGYSTKAKQWDLEVINL